jgi:hypothetical protein
MDDGSDFAYSNGSDDENSQNPHVNMGEEYDAEVNETADSLKPNLTYEGD